MKKIKPHDVSDTKNAIIHNNRRWVTKTQYIDIDTAEIINKKQIQNGDYIKVYIDKTYVNDRNTATVNVLVIQICRRNPQLKLEL